MHMQAYETTMIARPDLSTQQADVLAQKFQDVLRAQGAQMHREESWGLRTLAYPINKHRKGHYRYFSFQATGAAIEEMERQMRLNEDVMRFLTIRLETLPTEQTPVMKAAEAPTDRRSYGSGSGSHAASSADEGPESVIDLTSDEE